MKLRYFDRAAIVVTFDPETLEATFEPVEEVGRAGECSGICTLLGGRFLALVKEGNALRFFVGQRSADFVEVEFDLRGSFTRRQLTVRLPSGDVEEFVYRPAGWIENDPTPHVEREDFDFGMFLVAMAANPQRRQVVLEVWT